MSSFSDCLNGRRIKYIKNKNNRNKPTDKISVEFILREKIDVACSVIMFSQTFFQYQTTLIEHMSDGRDYTDLSAVFFPFL